MKPGIPWSVKGIDGKAREIAKDAARSQGKTLGEWLNMKILEAASEDADLKASAPRKKASSSVKSRNSRSRSASTSRGNAKNAAKNSPTAEDSSIERKLDMLVASLSEMQEREQIAEQPQHALSVGAPEQSEQASTAAIDQLLNRIEQGETRAQESVKTLSKRVEKIGDRVEEMALRPVDVKAREVPGFSALEGAVRNIVDHIEKSEHQSREVIGQLQSRIVELDGKVDQPSPESAKPEILADLEARMKELSARVEQTANSGEDLELKSLFEARIRELAERIDSVHHTAENIGQKAEATVGKAAEEQAIAIETRMAGLVQQVEEKLAVTGTSDTGLVSVQAEISELHNRFEEIRQQSASDQEVQALRGALEMLSSKVDEAPGLEPIAQIEQRIADLSQQLQQVAQPADYQPQLGALEERIIALDNQIAASSSASIPQFTNQMQAIDQRLTATEQQLGSLATIENSIQQLFASLEENRSEVHMLAGIASNGETSGPVESSAELSALQEGLAAVRANADAADQRTQATLEAVHETLSHIITKLGEVDGQRDSQAQDNSTETADIDGLASGVAASAAAIAAAPPESQQSTQNEETGRDETENGADQLSSENNPDTVPTGTTTHPETLHEPADQQSGNHDWLTVVRSHMRDNHGISSDVPMSMSPQTMAASNTATTVDDQVDFIAAARQAASTGTNSPDGAPGAAAPAGFGGFDPHADEDDLEDTLFAAASSRKERSGRSNSKGRANSSRKRLILAAVVLLAAVSAYTTNSRFFNSIPAKLISDTAPATVEKTAMVEPAEARKQQTEQSKIELPTSGAAIVPHTTGRKDSMQSDPITTASVGAAKASDPLLSHAPDTLGVPLSSSGASRLPEQIGTTELRQAAMQGNSSAQFIIASRFLEGRQVGRDHKKAAQWYIRAAESGLATAQYRIGTLYERGNGVTQDRFQAMSWYAKAANQGNVKAMHNLAVMSADTANGKPDLARAAKWFAAAAKHGLPDSQYNFAVLNERGLGIQKNPVEAYKWYSIAARSGDRDAVKKAEEINATMDRTALADIDKMIASWNPAAPQREANMVSVTDPSWGIKTNNHQAAAKVPSGQTADQPATAKDRVKLVQQLLAKKGFDAGVSNGEMGASTANAIRLYQLRHGLPVNGIVSKQLLDHLQRGLI